MHTKRIWLAVAAAIGTLKTFGSLDVAEQQTTALFLAEMQSDEGGLTANTRIPFADLLSSFTGLLTLNDLESAELVNIQSINRYALSMQSPKSNVQSPITSRSFFNSSQHLAACKIACSGSPT